MSLPEKPLTRRELYLAKAAGQNVTLPETDLTREEMYLREIANGGGGGDVTKEYVDNAISNAVADIDDDISALSDTVADKVDKVTGKGLSTNDYTDADKALVQDSPITVTATASPLSTANGKLRKLTIFGKSEVVDGVIKSAGEGYAVVDLGTLNWTYTQTTNYSVFEAPINGMFNPTTPSERLSGLLCSKYPISTQPSYATMDDKSMLRLGGKIIIKDGTFTDATAFKTAMSGVLLCYQLADPTQGNAVAIKTDNGTGIGGTMATFSTGTPLYGINDTVRDVMEWDGSAGTVTKNCAKVRLEDLSWLITSNRFYTQDIRATVKKLVSYAEIPNAVCAKYITVSASNSAIVNNSITIDPTGDILIHDETYTTVSDFVSSLGDAELVYELAIPTTEQLTATENDSLSTLKTYSPQTTITINDNPKFEVEAYANTANGQAISDMQPTRSPLLTLTASGWTNNAQTVTYAHDTGKRNTIDVEPASIKVWTAAGILATAETASTITFECDTTPTADLSFRVTSMEVR